MTSKQIIKIYKDRLNHLTKVKATKDLIRQCRNVIRTYQEYGDNYLIVERSQSHENHRN